MSENNKHKLFIVLFSIALGQCIFLYSKYLVQPGFTKMAIIVVFCVTCLIGYLLYQILIWEHFLLDVDNQWDNGWFVLSIASLYKIIFIDLSSIPENWDEMISSLIFFSVMLYIFIRLNTIGELFITEKDQHTQRKVNH